MKKTVTNIRIEHNKHRIRIRIEGDPTPRESPLYQRGQFVLLKLLTESPDLLDCGLSPFQTLHVFHNGECWVAEAEAVVDAPTLGGGSVPSSQSGTA